MTTYVGSYNALTEVAVEARPYPTYLLENADTGLCLFSAAFLGHNEAIHFALENVTTTCVDLDGPRLAEMAQLYPRDWKWAVDDAWKYAEDAFAIGESWDVVSVDTFRGNATEKSLQTLPLWCSIANQTVLCTLEIDQAYDVPDGWEATLFKRNSEVFWLVLARA